MNKQETVSIGGPVKGMFSSKLPRQNDTVGLAKYSGLNLKLNSRKYRCDEFIEKHDGLHLLFSGCSVTYGDGLLEDEIWAKKLYNIIKEKEKVSGYFNLGISGSNVFDIVINIFRYISEFGNPDAIFICLPSVRRYALNFDDNRSLSDVCTSVYLEGITDEYFEISKMQSFQYLFMLEYFCKVQDIKLYLFTYDASMQYNHMPLNNFYPTSRDDMINFISQNFIDSSANPNMLKARDKKHFGEAYHEYWSRFCYNLYIKDK